MPCRAEPIGGPLPQIANHIVEAPVHLAKGTHGRGPFIAIFGRVGQRKIALPDIATVFAIRLQVAAPWIHGSLVGAARCVLTLGFSGQALTGPLRIRNGIVPRLANTG